ncbi:hypothetical protein BT63DRAFT_458098 [Microthyrium microscopicum]|uniref:F-box domain-containing protein n=1 Tax=Microthyrium microscopicum TaxID=703497 RepID=A0A6A6U6S2_9PEZI|nr:hypothetical protein BT63DRAFT_458098 [Microthyrium microscopicum]
MASKLSYNEFVHIGKQNYREKNFEAALANFKNALKVAKEPNLDILEFLAAATEKLGELETSLKYGKQMVDQSEGNTRGYLRLGKTLEAYQKESQRKKGLMIYDRGLTKVSAADPYFKLLQSTRHRLYLVIEGPNAKDPLTAFPYEVAQIVMSYLPFHQVIKCLAVSKGWRGYLSSCPELWLDIDLSHGKTSRQKRIPRAFVKSCVKYSDHQVKSLKLGCFAHRPTVLAIAMTCKKLESIEIPFDSDLGGDTLVETLKYSKSLRRLCAKVALPSDQINQILERSSGLTHLDVGWISPGTGRILFASTFSLPNLKHFECRGHSSRNVEITGPNLHQFLNSVPNLESFCLTSATISSLVADFGLLKKLKSLNLESVYFGVGTSLSLPPTLEKLALRSVLGRLIGWGNLPHLKHIELRNCYDVPALMDRLLQMTATESPEVDSKGELICSKLETLMLVGMVWSGNTIAAQIFSPDLRSIFKQPRVSEVKTLVVQGPEFLDETVQVIEENLTKLNMVKMTTTGVSGVAIKKLVQSQKKLEWIILENCLSVSPDAVTWAKSQGINIRTRSELAPRGQTIWR